MRASGAPSGRACTSTWRIPSTGKSWRMRGAISPDPPSPSMIPSTLAAEVSGALRDFLSTGFYEAADALPATESGAGPSSDGDGTGSEQPEVDSERAHERREREPDRPGRREAPDAQSGGHGGTRVGPVHRIHYADDLKPDEDSVHLPLIQCRECHATAWGGVKHAGEQRVNQDLRAFYNRFFLRDVDVNYLFPLSPDEPSPQNVPGRELNICGRCGCLAGHDAEACPGCGQDHLTRVFRPEVVGFQGRRQAGERRRPAREVLSGIRGTFRDNGWHRQPVAPIPRRVPSRCRSRSLVAPAYPESPDGGDEGTPVPAQRRGHSGPSHQGDSARSCRRCEQECRQGAFRRAQSPAGAVEEGQRSRHLRIPG